MIIRSHQRHVLCTTYIVRGTGELTSSSVCVVLCLCLSPSGSVSLSVFLVSVAFVVCAVWLVALCGVCAWCQRKLVSDRGLFSMFQLPGFKKSSTYMTGQFQTLNPVSTEKCLQSLSSSHESHCSFPQIIGLLHQHFNKVN